ncbi:hypothetical protein HMPREF3156_01353 [Neisseria sp. HMSC06F02]|nr:hypothetical protein HMPREF3156_01353 [Neisseria sp. HMSC06F02]
MRSTLSLFCGGLKWNGLYRLSRKIPVFRRLTVLCDLPYYGCTS